MKTTSALLVLGTSACYTLVEPSSGDSSLEGMPLGSSMGGYGLGFGGPYNPYGSMLGYPYGSLNGYGSMLGSNYGSMLGYPYGSLNGYGSMLGSNYGGMLGSNYGGMLGNTYGGYNSFGLPRMGYNYLEAEKDTEPKQVSTNP